MADEAPLITFDPDGKAAVLSYDIPEPTSYSGRNLIELDLPASHFKAELSEPPIDRDRIAVGDLDISAVVTAVSTSMRSAFSDDLLPNARVSGANLRYVREEDEELRAISSEPLNPQLARLDPEEVASMLKAGYRLNVYRSMFGTLVHNYVPEPPRARPRLFLVELHRLTSFLGRYGAGRIIKTFSLLPGEKTRVSIQTYTKQATTAKSASSVLDSFTQESANDFESSIQAEQSDRREYESTFEYHSEAEASASWGFGKAKVSGGLKGGTNSAREEFSKNLTSALQKHSARSSAKRDVQINTSYEITSEEGQQTSIEREIENINLSRTLQFVFRQMNQEFISLVHLEDVRVGFFNGFGQSRREVPLSRLDELLDEVLVDDDDVKSEVKRSIVDQLSYVFDHQYEHHCLVETKSFVDAEGYPVAGADYLHIKRDYRSRYVDPDSGKEFDVPGVIVAAQKNVLRTEGVVVESMLGRGDALDAYAQRLQELEVEHRTQEVRLQSAKAATEELVHRVVDDNDSERAQLLTALFGSRGADEEDDTP